MIKISLSLPGDTIRGPLPGIISFSGQREMNCDDWPEDLSLLELKALLRTGVYTNIGIDCNATQSKKVCLMCFCKFDLY